ncbi:MAG: hypothetical protein IJ773_14815 [Lachnospiraceae bacterium]|nr:hypothetical protein [Lachnospiraceae bacterium]
MRLIEANEILSPKGLKMGTRFNKDGKTMVHYKVNKKYDDMTPEVVVECITGLKVKEIIYEGPRTNA